MPSPPRDAPRRWWAAALLLLAAVAIALWWWDREERSSADEDAAVGEASDPEVANDGVATPFDPHAHPRLTASIAGTVTGNGAPLPGASVCAIAAGGALASELVRDPSCRPTDGDGRYRIEGLPAGRYDVTAHAPRHRPARYGGPSRDPALSLRAGEAKADVDLVLAPGGVPVRGVVLDGLGGTIEGAWVQARPGQWPTMGVARTAGWPVRSDAEGRFEVWTAPGEIGLVAQADGYAPAHRITTAPTDAVVVRLLPEAVVEGVVVDAATGDPVADALVSASAKLGGANAYSDPEGHFRIDRLPAGRVKVSAQTDDAQGRLPGDVVVGLGKTARVRIEMYPSRTVVGRVLVAGSDTPCDAGRVTLAPPAGAPLGGLIEPDGSVRIRGVDRATYRVMIQCPGRLTDPSAPQLLVGDGPIPAQTWTVQPGLTLEGVVVDDAGNAVEGARVEATPTGQDARAVLSRGETITGAGGTFTLPGLQAGSYRVVARSGSGTVEGDAVERELEADASAITLVLPRGAEISGHVRDEGGAPIADAQLLALPSDRGDGAGRAFSDHEGRYVIAAIGPGSYRVHAEGMADDAGETVTIAAGERQTLDLTVPIHDHEIDGVVVDAEGSPVADATVSLARDPYTGWAWRDSTWVLTDAEGRFAFDRLAEGSYRLEASRAAATEGALDGVHAGDTVELRLSALASVRGTVRVADGTAPARFVITARGSDLLVESFHRTGGEWSIDGLAPGEYGLHVEADEGTASTTFELAAGEAKTGVALELARPGEVTGEVVDAKTGEPVVGVRVHASDPTGVTRHRATDALDAGNITDARGRFRVTAGPGAVRLELRAPPGPTQYLRLSVPAKVEPAAELDLGTVELPAACLSSGQEPGRFGFSWNPPAGGMDGETGVAVSAVSPGTPMAKAGLAVGDEIVAVDGVSVAGGGWPNLHQLVTCPAGHAATFTLADGRSLEVVAVPRR